MTSKFAKYEKPNENEIPDEIENQYGSMIFLSEDAKEKVRNMSESELNMISSFLAHSFRQAQIKIENEFHFFEDSKKVE